MLLRLLMAPITGPIEGITWIASQIHDRVQAELNDRDNLHKQLLTLQLAFDMGEISEEDFEQQEAELLAAIEALAAEEAKDAEE